MHEPDNGSSHGHAAVGFVMGQRYADGKRPELVEIAYERSGAERTETVVRNSGRVEFSKTASVQFVTDDNRTITIDALLGAKPVPKQHA